MTKHYFKSEAIDISYFGNAINKLWNDFSECNATIIISHSVSITSMNIDDTVLLIALSVIYK